jgi:hypothetical protein
MRGRQVFNDAKFSWRPISFSMSSPARFGELSARAFISCVFGVCSLKYNIESFQIEESFIHQQESINILKLGFGVCLKFSTLYIIILTYGGRQ